MLRFWTFKKSSVKIMRKVINYPPLNLLLHYPEDTRQERIKFINYNEFLKITEKEIISDSGLTVNKHLLQYNFKLGREGV